ncbi:MAG: hypothetical protein ACI304_01770 [Lepagella sp.]
MESNNSNNTSANQQQPQMTPPPYVAPVSPVNVTPNNFVGSAPPLYSNQNQLPEITSAKDKFLLAIGWIGIILSFVIMIFKAM